jgi:starch-binding outer membrane protein, SusD/RagB family
MKKIIYIFILLMIAGSASFYSCKKDFFDKPQTSDVTLEKIFSNRAYAEDDLWRVYNQLATRGWENYASPGGGVFLSSMLCSISDECDSYRGIAAGSNINLLGLTAVLPASNGLQRYAEDDFLNGYAGIRQAYIFLENIDVVSEIPQAERDQMKLEAKLLIAMRYAEMLKRYGGVPIVTKSLFFTEKIEAPRASYKETVDFILGICDQANALPDKWESKWKGRMTKGAALALKARTLLYAASPLYNATQSILSYSKPELICYGNYDVNRWKLAVDANIAVLNWAAANGIELINTGNPFEDYGTAVSLSDNKEIILANKWSTTDNGFNQQVRPFSIRGFCLTFNFLPQFRKANGTDQVWNEDMNVRYPYSQYKTKMDELEPRFQQCVWIAGDKYPKSNISGTGMDTWDFAGNGEAAGASGMRGVGRFSKYLYKYANEPFKDYPIFRLAEFYLSFAEAANEFYGPNITVSGTTLTAVSALNTIRIRGGLAPVVTNDKDALRNFIKRERAVEYFGEGQRNWDLRRWKEADVNGGDYYGFFFKQASDNKSYTTYFKGVAESRFWAPSQYFYPFPQEEINKGYLIQNPGY